VIDLVTTFVDIDRGRLLDVVPGFSGVLVFWCSGVLVFWCSGA